MDWLAQIAPTIATALGGPLAGLAVTSLAKVFGVPEKDVQGMIESGKMSAEQLQQVKLAELELQKQAQALGLNFETLATEDRKSARYADCNKVCCAAYSCRHSNDWIFWYLVCNDVGIC